MKGNDTASAISSTMPNAIALRALLACSPSRNGFMMKVKKLSNLVEAVSVWGCSFRSLLVLPR